MIGHMLGTLLRPAVGEQRWNWRWNAKRKQWSVDWKLTTKFVLKRTKPRKETHNGYYCHGLDDWWMESTSWQEPNGCVLNRFGRCYRWSELATNSWIIFNVLAVYDWLMKFMWPLHFCQMCGAQSDLTTRSKFLIWRNETITNLLRWSGTKYLWPNDHCHWRSRFQDPRRRLCQWLPVPTTIDQIVCLSGPPPLMYYAISWIEHQLMRTKRLMRWFVWR